ncbi:unnamed protein product [Amoebophrya sp. A25]|nr:unnamed protein product [Amoebophrya sp. A25]|eukprot:GSA25T00011530001.1
MKTLTIRNCSRSWGHCAPGFPASFQLQGRARLSRESSRSVLENTASQTRTARLVVGSPSLYHERNYGSSTGILGGTRDRYFSTSSSSSSSSRTAASSFSASPTSSSASTENRTDIDQNKVSGNSSIPTSSISTSASSSSSSSSSSATASQTSSSTLESSTEFSKKNELELDFFLDETHEAFSKKIERPKVTVKSAQDDLDGGDRTTSARVISKTTESDSESGSSSKSSTSSSLNFSDNQEQKNHNVKNAKEGQEKLNDATSNGAGDHHIRNSEVHSSSSTSNSKGEDPSNEPEQQGNNGFSEADVAALREEVKNEHFKSLWAVHHFASGAETWNEKMRPHQTVVWQVDSAITARTFFKSFLVKIMRFFFRERSEEQGRIGFFEEWYSVPDLMSHCNQAYRELLRRLYEQDFANVYDLVTQEMETQHFSMNATRKAHSDCPKSSASTFTSTTSTATTGTGGKQGMDAGEGSRSQDEDEKIYDNGAARDVSLGLTDVNLFLLREMRKANEADFEDRAEVPWSTSTAKPEIFVEKIFGFGEKSPELVKRLLKNLEKERSSVAGRPERGSGSRRKSPSSEDSDSDGPSGSEDRSTTKSDGKINTRPPKHGDQEADLPSDGASKSWTFKLGPISFQVQKYEVKDLEHEEKLKSADSQNDQNKKPTKDIRDEEQEAKAKSASSSTISTKKDDGATSSTGSTWSTQDADAQPTSRPDGNASSTRTSKPDGTSAPDVEVISSEIRFRALRGPLMFRTPEENAEVGLNHQAIRKELFETVDLHLDLDAVSRLLEKQKRVGGMINVIERTDQLRLTCKFNIPQGIASGFRLSQMQNLSLEKRPALAGAGCPKA